jgi:predicted nucleotidyltransferase
MGVNSNDVAESRKPEKKLKSLMNLRPKDELVSALQHVLDITTQHSSLQIADFGVFGSILHGFHHPRFSDIDLITYGRRSVDRLHQTLQELYADGSSALRNEFETDESVRQKNWRFQNYSPQEYVAHQRRKMIYAEFYDRKSSRKIKTEFEPVKAWNEISNERDSQTKIVPRDWVSITARVTEDQDAPFIPSVYQIEPLKVLDGTTVAIEARRVVSFVEEFRMQAKMDETVHIEGNLEEVTTAKESFLQIALTYCPRYYEQVLKVVH